MLIIWHTVMTGKFCRKFENKDNLFQMEGVSDLSNELCYSVEIAVNNTLKEPGSFVKCCHDFFPWGVQTTGSLHQH